MLGSVCPSLLNSCCMYMGATPVAFVSSVAVQGIVFNHLCRIIHSLDQAEHSVRTRAAFVLFLSSPVLQLHLHLRQWGPGLANTVLLVLLLQHCTPLPSSVCSIINRDCLLPFSSKADVIPHSCTLLECMCAGGRRWGGWGVGRGWFQGLPDLCSWCQALLLELSIQALTYLGKCTLSTTRCGTVNCTLHHKHSICIHVLSQIMYCVL